MCIQSAASAQVCFFLTSLCWKPHIEQISFKADDRSLAISRAWPWVSSPERKVQFLFNIYYHKIPHKINRHAPLSIHTFMVYAASLSVHLFLCLSARYSCLSLFTILWTFFLFGWWRGWENKVLREKTLVSPISYTWTSRIISSTPN